MLENILTKVFYAPLYVMALILGRMLTREKQLELTRYLRRKNNEFEAKIEQKKNPLIIDEVINNEVMLRWFLEHQPDQEEDDDANHSGK